MIVNNLTLCTQGSITSSIIGFFSGLGDAAKKYGTGIAPGEACDNLTYEKDGGTDGVNEMGLAFHVLELGEPVSCRCQFR